MGLTPNEMNTPEAKKRKEWFDKVAKEGYSPSGALPEPKSLEEEAQQRAAHAARDVPPVAVLAKGYQYAQRGSNFIRKLGGRGVYNAVDERFVREEFGEEFIATFPDLRASQNFDPGARSLKGKKAGQTFPYPWEAHHLLPASAFYYETEVGDEMRPVFTPDQYRLLLTTDYNINLGHNIIMLPKQARAVPVHKLIQHPSDHPEYTQRVMADMRQVSDDLQKLMRKVKDHDAVKASLAANLKRLEEDYWRTVVALGRDSVRAVSAGERLGDNSVRYVSKSGTVYQWGALA